MYIVLLTTLVLYNCSNCIISSNFKTQPLLVFNSVLSYTNAHTHAVFSLSVSLSLPFSLSPDVYGCEACPHKSFSLRQMQQPVTSLPSPSHPLVRSATRTILFKCLTGFPSPLALQCSPPAYLSCASFCSWPPLFSIAHSLHPGVTGAFRAPVSQGL